MSHTYAEAIQYLEELVQRAPSAGDEAVVDRTDALLRTLGRPERAFPVVHVAGSVGKGSTATATAALLQSAGLETGLFTSPHLVDYTERIAINGQAIAEDVLAAILDDVYSHLSAPGATLLEVLWPAAALYFAHQGVDVAVVECGLGGRFDPTVVSDAPVAVITTIELEHVDRLGSSLASIAWHKAGIIKPHARVITGVRSGPALEVIATECSQRGATLWRLGQEITTERSEGGLRVDTPLDVYTDIVLSMHGVHQEHNAALALAAAAAFADMRGTTIGEMDARMALTQAVAPARFEVLADEPVVVLDGAHNAPAATALAATIASEFPERLPIVLFGALADKDIEAMVAALALVATGFVLTESPYRRRAGTIGRAAVAARQAGFEPVLEPDLERALAAGMERAEAAGVPLVVTGSMMLVGAVRQMQPAPNAPGKRPRGRRRG